MASKPRSPKEPKRGRPPTVSPRGSEPFTVRLPRDYKAALIKEAARRKIDAGQVLRERLGLA